MAAPTFVNAGAAAFTATNNGSFTPALPAFIGTNDILILWTHQSNNTAISTISGWTKITPGGQAENNTTAQHVEVWWKRAGASESAPTLTLTTNNVTIVRGGRMVAVRGCPTSGDPFSNSSRLNTASASAINTTSMTPAENNTFNLFLGAFEDDPTTASQPAGWSTVTLAGSSLGNGMALTYATLTQATAAALNPSTTLSGGTFAASPAVGILLSLKGISATPRVQSIWIG